MAFRSLLHPSHPFPSLRHLSTSSPTKPPSAPASPFKTYAYPLLLLSILTSLTLNLRSSRHIHTSARNHLQTQLSVLSSLLSSSSSSTSPSTTGDEGEKWDEERVRRELEMVGLRTRRLAEEAAKVEVEAKRVGRDVSWTEAVFGRRDLGVGEEAEREWEEVKRLAFDTTTSTEAKSASP